MTGAARIPAFQGENFAKNLELVRRVQEIAAEKGVKPSQLALAWVLAQSDDIIPIPGTRRSEHPEENLAALEIPLEAAALARLDAAAPKGVAAGERYTEAGMRVVVSLKDIERTPIQFLLPRGRWCHATSEARREVELLDKGQPVSEMRTLAEAVADWPWYPGGGGIYGAVAYSRAAYARSSSAWRSVRNSAISYTSSVRQGIAPTVAGAVSVHRGRHRR